ncbi:unnamed protein product [Rangifer tarandus platyrhynchus]|uniref:Uncharacterized protein n=1 Tax=Rangifer tarandus platyrhynchus TaxID=3082113 RepID=A0ABN8Y6S0_RANTA|nr:unnamed protein product [Rangifer tarandus platyrhynchus]
MPGVVSYAKGGVRQRSRESRPARAGEEGEESRDPRLQTSVRCAPPRKEGTREQNRGLKSPGALEPLGSAFCNVVSESAVCVHGFHRRTHGLHQPRIGHCV